MLNLFDTLHTVTNLSKSSSCRNKILMQIFQYNFFFKVTCWNALTIHLGRVYLTHKARDPEPPTLPGVMASWSSNWGYSEFCWPHTITNTIKMCPLTCVACHGCLSERSDFSRCRWHKHLTNHNYCDREKTQIPPIGAPCREENGVDSQISGLNLWLIFKKEKQQVEFLCKYLTFATKAFIELWKDLMHYASWHAFSSTL